jgi:hypothetical protein
MSKMSFINFNFLDRKLALFHIAFQGWCRPETLGLQGKGRFAYHQVIFVDDAEVISKQHCFNIPDIPQLDQNCRDKYLVFAGGIYSSHKI